MSLILFQPALRHRRQTKDAHHLHSTTTSLASRASEDKSHKLRRTSGWLSEWLKNTTSILRAESEKNYACARATISAQNESNNGRVKFFKGIDHHGLDDKSDLTNDWLTTPPIRTANLYGGAGCSQTTVHLRAWQLTFSLHPQAPSLSNAISQSRSAAMPYPMNPCARQPFEFLGGCRGTVPEGDIVERFPEKNSRPFANAQVKEMSCSHHRSAISAATRRGMMYLEN